jgi:lysophospholipase L1-like esterase
MSRRRNRLAGLALMLLGTLTIPDVAPAADECVVQQPDLLESPYRLERFDRSVRAGQPIRIVALGSSSTEGVGASSSLNAYPARLQRILARELPGSAIAVINKGVGGQDARQMIERLERDVFRLEPDLVIWQTGTNSAIRDEDLGSYLGDVLVGIHSMRSRGIDVLLMGPQKSPRVDVAKRRAEFSQHLKLIADVARIPFFARYEVMSGWLATGQMTMTTMIDPDGLHMTDLSYRCLGEALAKLLLNVTRANIATR